MAIWTYEKVTPTPIANTTIERAFADGVHKRYCITPNNGYILHDTDYDRHYDIEGDELTEPILGFGKATVSCAANYDFTANPRQFYAVPEDEYNQKMKEIEKENEHRIGETI